MGIQEAYYNTLTTTGEAVSLTGAMLAVGVATWIWSPIKFQADMGMLLTFMFVWNMVGALWLLPALAHFLIKPEKFVAIERKTHGERSPCGMTRQRVVTMNSITDKQRESTMDKQP